ncbi:MAG: magnesium transporter [Vicingaceae bacterium]|jgi:magnesium transporter|tara:strand:- start:3200 stop:4558 length:1359 start_codon:yes stop_codon:yes gene_type:complete
MQFELSKEYISELQECLNDNLKADLLNEVNQLHPADIADICDELETEEVVLLYQCLDSEIATDVLVELEEDVREKLLRNLSPKEIAENFIDNMDSDDAADIMAELSDEKKDEVISAITDIHLASDIVDLLLYPEDSAGGLMAKELIKVHINWTLIQCLREMRKQAEDIEDVYTIYVVDNLDKLIGTLSLKKLLLAPDGATVKDLYFEEIRSVKAYEKSDEIASIMEKYDLVVLPVVDELNRLIGRITIDDIVDVIKEEADKDYQMASGISESVDSTDSVKVLTRARLPWLLVGLLGGILGALVIGQYEDTLQIYPEMALFIPLIAAMGGNVGVQSSAIIVQGLANNSLGFDNLFQRLRKEFLVALLNGVVCSILIFAYTILYKDSNELAATVSVALVLVIIFAGLFGTFVPLMLDKFKIDPALATGPFITTMNDIVGLFIYFGIGHLMYIWL